MTVVAETRFGIAQRDWDGMVTLLCTDFENRDMTFLVPFDGSPLSQAALRRAAEIGAVLDEAIIAVTVIPEDNADYATERGWLGDGEFDVDAIVDTLAGQVDEIADGAEFRTELVDRYAPSGTISKKLRSVADDIDATMVFLGSENAGRLVTSLSSVGDGVAADGAYDVVIVRHGNPATIAGLDRAASVDTDQE